MISTVLVGLIVIFGAGLMGKMLKDMYPGALFGGSQNTTDGATPVD